MNYNTQDPFVEYTTVIRELSSVAAQISRVEETKVTVAAEKHHHLLNECIQEEQALLLKLRGLEQRRIKCQKTLDWEDLTIKQILEKASPTQLETLSPLFQDLEQQLKRLTHSRDAAEKILNVRLRELEIIAMQQQGSAYDSERKAAPAASSAARIHDTYV